MPVPGAGCNGVALLVSGVHIHVMLENDLSRSHKYAFRCLMQRRPTLDIQRVRIRTTIEKKLRNLFTLRPM